MPHVDRNRGTTHANAMKTTTRNWFYALAAIVVGGGLAAKQLATFSHDVSLTGWEQGITGYARAVVEQTRTGKPIALYFYADWCNICKRLRNEVLATPEVSAFMRDYIPVKVDPEYGPAEQALAERFGVVGYPTFFIIPGATARPVEITRVGGADAAQFMAACARASGAAAARVTAIP